jgi:Rab5 GDP/GTP exchange factor
MGAIQFIENLDRTSLTISDEEFESNVEAAVSAIAEKHEEEEKAAMNHVHIPKKSSVSRPEVTPRTSMDVEYSTPKRSPSRDGARLSSSADITEEKDAVAGLLRTIQRPLSTIGRMFSEEPSSNPQSAQRSPNLAPTIPPGRHPVETPIPGNTPRLSPAPPLPSRNNGETRWQASDMAQVVDLAQKRERVRLSAEESAARQASAETAEAQRIQRAEHADVVEYAVSRDRILLVKANMLT